MKPETVELPDPEETPMPLSLQPHHIWTLTQLPLPPPAGLLLGLLSRHLTLGTPSAPLGKSRDEGRGKTSGNLTPGRSVGWTPQEYGCPSSHWPLPTCPWGKDTGIILTPSLFSNSQSWCPQSILLQFHHTALNQTPIATHLDYSSSPLIGLVLPSLLDSSSPELFYKDHNPAM